MAITMAQLPEALLQSLITMGFIDGEQTVTGEPLTGGVASDIWRIDTDGKSSCAKRALEQLKVSREWRVPVDRNAYEVAWFETVASIAPDSVPKILGHDPVSGVFVMEFFPPEQYSVWKSQLHAGVVDRQTVVGLAATLARIHSGTASNVAIANQFDRDDLFYSLRLEPYLHATAESHPDLQEQLGGLASMVASNKRALVHGDISPKNILVGPRGPIIIDAECAWYGDPAFDVAFCLNHLLLKCLWTPSAKFEFINGFDLLVKTYLLAVDWESAKGLEQRAARLLPGLMLGRIDGKSPVEYITDDAEKNKVRRFARRFLLQPVDKLRDISAAWLAND